MKSIKKYVAYWLIFTGFQISFYTQAHPIAKSEQGRYNSAPQDSLKTNPVFDKGEPKLVSEQFSFTEGPAADRKGNIFFTDQPNNKIWKYGTDGKLTLFLDSAGRSNGMYFDRKGNLVTCADEKDELWSISPSGKISVLMTDYKGQRFNGPNDLWIHPNGNIYFTDPYYQRDYWERKTSALDGEKVYLLPAGSRSAVVVDSTIIKPNGIIGTPDGKILYVADIKDNKTYRYQIDHNGHLSERTLFVNQGSDGMTIDNQGNIYLTGRGVTVFNKDGKQIAYIDIPGKWTANVCFGGKKRNILFITSTKAVYVLPTKVKGA